MRFLNFLFLCGFSILVSCSSAELNPKLTKIFGKVVNPLDTLLIISKNGRALDTAMVAKDGHFFIEFKQEAESIYYFKHGSERQMLYTKPGDSIALRLNTIAFDETLVFDADSSQENNFLMDCFLLNEKNNELILSFYKTEVDEFLKLTDSLKSIQVSKLHSLKERKKLSPYFLEIASKSIDFEFFDMKERYAFLIQKYFREKYSSLEETNFFEYRQTINFNEEQLFSHIGYLRFLDNYLKNKSIENCTSVKDAERCFDLNTFQNLQKRIELVDATFEDNIIKEQFLKRFIRREIIHATNDGEVKSILDYLQDIQLSEEEKLYYHRLADFQSNFLVGKSINEHFLINHKLEEVAIHHITKSKPVLIYLWTASSTTLHQKRLAKIKELRKKFPEIEFIGVNIDYNNPILWQRTIKQFKYNPKYEYQVLKSDENKDLYENYLTKLFFVSAATGEITNTTNLLYSDNLESTILSFLNN